LPDEVRRTAPIAALLALRLQRARDAAVQEARHVHAVSYGEHHPLPAADAAAAAGGAARAVERLVEVHDEAAVIDEHFLAFADVARGDDIPGRVEAAVGGP